MNHHQIQMLIVVLLTNQATATRQLLKDFSQAEIDALIEQAHQLDWRK